MFVYSRLRHMMCKWKYYGDNEAKAETVTPLIYGCQYKSWTRKLHYEPS